MVQNTDIFSCGICEQNEENLVDFLRHKLRRECLCLGIFVFINKYAIICFPFEVQCIYLQFLGY